MPDNPYYQQGRIGSLTGMPVIETRNIPRGQVIKIENTLYVNSMWFDIQFPIMIADVRKTCRADLAKLVRAAEKRLGLEPLNA